MMCMIQIVSTGPGDPGLINRKTLETMEEAGRLVLRTEKNPLADWLRKNHISFSSMDRYYDISENFDDLFSCIADEVWKEASIYGCVVYAVTDAATDRSVEQILLRKPDNGSVYVIPGFSYYDYYLSACRTLFQTSNMHICPASDFLQADADLSAALLITEIDSEIIAGEIKNRLTLWMEDEEKIYIIERDRMPLEIPLFELDRRNCYDHRTAVAIGGKTFLQRKKKTFSDLIRIMELLRSRDGCPWDREQTHESLKQYVVEEAWETVDAIEEKDPAHLAEELGDLLFQVVFHTSIGKAFGEFDISDVVSGICNKMIRRHPHVFAGGKTGNGSFTSADWERIKREENGISTTGESLLHISSSLPSLQYAEKVVKKLDSISEMCRPAEETLSSLLSEAERIRSAEPSDIPYILGRMLLYCAELSYRYGRDGETLLHQTTKKLIDNYHQIELRANRNDKSPECLTFKDLGL